MPSKLNQLAKDELRSAFADVPSAIFVDFTGVGSEETFRLRKALAESSMKLRVVKTTLAKIALKELGTGLEESQFDGPIGVIYSEDPVAVAKLILEHRKKFRGTPLKVKGGYLERRPLRAEEVTDLSNLPDRHQLLGMVAGAFAAPITAFVNTQAEVIRKLLYGLEAIKDKREKAEAA